MVVAVAMLSILKQKHSMAVKFLNYLQPPPDQKMVVKGENVQKVAVFLVKDQMDHSDGFTITERND